MQLLQPVWASFYEQITLLQLSLGSLFFVQILNITQRRRLTRKSPTPFLHNSGMVASSCSVFVRFRSGSLLFIACTIFLGHGLDLDEVERPSNYQPGTSIVISAASWSFPIDFEVETSLGKQILVSTNYMSITITDASLTTFRRSVQFRIDGGYLYFGCEHGVLRYWSNATFSSLLSRVVVHCLL